MWEKPMATPEDWIRGTPDDYWQQWRRASPDATLPVR
jgi:hypothetical protein